MVEEFRAAMLPDRRLHLQHGPIDLVISAESPEPGAVQRAYAAATDRFRGLLGELVDELPFLRRRAGRQSPEPGGEVARRMHRAVTPHCESSFVTPMAAVAGAVADEILAAMKAVVRLDRAYVNNGGDISLHLDPGQSYRIAIAGPDGKVHGRFQIDASSAARGVATSGQCGRSHSLGIADSVTVLGKSAAAADAAATLVANAVDIPGHPEVIRQPARELSPDSDLGERLVVVATGHLEPREIEAALIRGTRAAAEMQAAGLLDAAALLLRGALQTIGSPRRFQGIENLMLRHG